MTSLEPFEVCVVHGVAGKGFGLAEVAVELQESQVVFEQVANGHWEIIVTEKNREIIFWSNVTPL